MKGSSVSHAFALVAVCSCVIMLLRALPFIVMSLVPGSKDGDAKWIKVAEKWLSPVIIAFLVVYSYSTLEWRTIWPYVAGAVVVLLQLVFRNGLVSVIAGTAVYMFTI